MSNRIHELLNRNLQEVFGEGDPPAVVRQSRSSTQKIVSSMCLPAFSFGTMRWTSSQATCARPTLILPTRLTASRRRYITLAVWRGSPARRERNPITLAWT
jgi:hypothetical protein